MKNETTKTATDEIVEIRIERRELEVERTGKAHGFYGPMGTRRSIKVLWNVYADEVFLRRFDTRRDAKRFIESGRAAEFASWRVAEARNRS